MGSSLVALHTCVGQLLCWVNNAEEGGRLGFWYLAAEDLIWELPSPNMVRLLSQDGGSLLSVPGCLVRWGKLDDGIVLWVGSS